MLSLEEVRSKLEVVNVAALSKKIGVHQNTIYRVVNGGSCNVQTLKKISDFFKDKNNNE